jgi:hypothetical protein
VPFLGRAEFSGVHNINIEIKDALHSDFSYDAVAWDKKILHAANDPNPILVMYNQNRLRAMKERNRIVSLFMRDLYEAAADEVLLEEFLEQFSQDNGKYVVEPMKYHSRRLS